MVINYWIDFEYKFKQFIFHYPALEFKEKKMLKPQWNWISDKGQKLADLETLKIIEIQLIKGCIETTPCMYMYVSSKKQYLVACGALNWKTHLISQV